MSSASLERKGSVKMLRVALFEGLRLLGCSLPLSSWVTVGWRLALSKIHFWLQMMTLLSA